MDCRTFHQKLEDYLEDGLDFSGRFGMERHARQCISCGKAMADAQHLRRMVSELHRVKAPANFESSVLKEIARRKADGRFWNLRRFWIFGFEWPSWRKLAFVSSSLAVLGFAIVYTFHQPAVEQVSTPPRAAVEPARAAIEVKEIQKSSGEKVGVPRLQETLTAKANKIEPKMEAPPAIPNPESLATRDAVDSDYVEYTIGESENHAVPVRLPKKIPLRYNPVSEEYFILNVSH